MAVIVKEVHNSGKVCISKSVVELLRLFPSTTEEISKDLDTKYDDFEVIISKDMTGY